MNAALWTCLSLLVAFGAAVAWLLRGTWSELATQAQIHAASYALSYLKGFALILIAGGACFTETFGYLTPAEVAGWQWWNWAVAFWKPVAAGLACMVAFLDNSMGKAKDEAAKANTKPPFVPPSS